MKKLSLTVLITIMFILGVSGLAMASETDTAVKVAGLKVFLGIVVAAGFGIAIAAIGTGLAQGIAIKGAVEGTARNPEASGKITVTMLIGLAMIESLCIYALVVALILLYAYPMSGPIKTLVGM
ncbi:MAG: ATP synthase F0 subunit C [Deltaproteobacteria bacterium]|nr:ATP synthase F0 subunit C [Deltaproteobacteria bacterium]